MKDRKILNLFPSFNKFNSAKVPRMRLNALFTFRHSAAFKCLNTDNLANLNLTCDARILVRKTARKQNPGIKNIKHCMNILSFIAVLAFLWFIRARDVRHRTCAFYCVLGLFRSAVGWAELEVATDSREQAKAGCEPSYKFKRGLINVHATAIWTSARTNSNELSRWTRFCPHSWRRYLS